MSSIIYIEQNERNRLVRVWKEQIFNMENKLNRLKQIAESLKENNLVEEINEEINSLKEEFEIVFNGGSNEEIVNKFDIRYWDADKVEARLREINDSINQIELNIQEKMIDNEILNQKLSGLTKQIQEYKFLSDLKEELKKINDLELNEKINFIEHLEQEINNKLSINQHIEQTKSNLRDIISELKNNINQYSFLAEFNKSLSEIEKELDSINGLEFDKLNYILNKFDDVKTKIEEKENTILNGIEAIKNYEIIKEEIKEIDDLVNNLNIGNKSKQIEQEKLKQVYNKFLKKLDYYSKQEAKRIDDLNVSLDNKLLELKIAYQKEKTKYLISKIIKDIKEKYKNDEKFMEKFENRLNQITEEKYLNDLLYDIEQYEAKNEMLKKQTEIIKQELKKMNYSLEEVQIGKIGYIDTKDKEYKIKYAFNEDGEIGFRFVRNGNIDNLNSYEKAKTVEKAKKWCSDFDKLNEELKRQGIEIDISLREEPKIEDIIFEDLSIEEVSYKEERVEVERYIEEDK